MNLHAIVSSAISVINPPFIGSVKVSTGYTVAADFTQVPAYTTVGGVSMQVQALTGREIEHLDSLNIQGIMRSVYLNGQIQGINRSVGRGGDILLIPTGLSGATPDVWLVVAVLEAWDADGWTKVAVVLQNNT